MSPRRFFSSILLATLTIFATASESIRINVDEAHPPFMSGRDGQAIGIYPSLIAAAFKHMNIQVSLEPKPWARAIYEIDRAQAGLAGVYLNSERLKKWDFSAPLLVERIVVYYHTARPVVFSTIGDLKGKRVGVMRGWSYGDAFDTARKAGLFQAEDVSTDDQNFLKLQSGRIDVAVAIPESVTMLLIQYKSISQCTTPLTEAASFLAFSKAAHQGALIEQFNRAIKEMKATGEFNRIITAESAH